MKKNPRHMSVREVADLYGVTTHTIYNWLKDVPGFPQPFTPTGKAMRFFREEIEDFFNKCCRSK